MNEAPMHLELDAMHNVRDLGGWPTADGRRTAYGRVWRGDSPARAGVADRDRLVEHGIRTVLDLRSASEHEREPSPLERDPRFTVHRIDLMAPLLADYVGGRRDGDPFDLQAQYRGFLLHASAELEEVLSILHGAVAEGEGALVHCTAGKDRTGVVAALLLAGAGTPFDVIAAEYALTDARIEALRPRLLEGAARHGIPTEAYARLLTADAETLRPVLDELPPALVSAARGVV